MRTLVLTALVALSGLSVWGCDSGPEGPGEMAATLHSPGPALGAAVLEVTGEGITGFSGAGGTRVFSAATGAQGTTFRVILLNETPGQLRFQVSVRNLGARKPTASVVSLVDGSNRTVPATPDYRVSFSR